MDYCQRCGSETSECGYAPCGAVREEAHESIVATLENSIACKRQAFEVAEGGRKLWMERAEEAEGALEAARQELAVAEHWRQRWMEVAREVDDGMVERAWRSVERESVGDPAPTRAQMRRALEAAFDVPAPERTAETGITGERLTAIVEEIRTEKRQKSQFVVDDEFVDRVLTAFYGGDEHHQIERDGMRAALAAALNPDLKEKP